MKTHLESGKAIPLPNPGNIPHPDEEDSLKSQMQNLINKQLQVKQKIFDLESQLKNLKSQEALIGNAIRDLRDHKVESRAREKEQQGQQRQQGEDPRRNTEGAVKAPETQFTPVSGRGDVIR